MKSLFVSAKVKRKMDSLRLTGKPGQALAQKVMSIIEDLTSGGGLRPGETVFALTKYGENRIHHCRKFDLGMGYRLIILQRDDRIFIPFLGTHDECRRWLENNSNLNRVAPGNWTRITVNPSDRPSNDPPNEMEGASEEDFEKSLMARITDRDLRYVFRGLVEGAQMRQG